MKKLTASIITLFILSLLFVMGCTQKEEIVLERDIIALLDTGVSTVAVKGENIVAGYNYVTNSDDTEDRINHGTAVASVILGSENAGIEGASPSTRVLPLVIMDKVEGKETWVSPETLATAIRDSVDKYGATVINVSLGIKKDVPELRSAIEYVQEKGALVIAAAGNDGDGELYYPAAYEGVLTVGSHDKNNKVSDFTQKNETVDILAPGEDIWLASRNGKTYGARGTSYATSFVAATASLIWQNAPSLTAAEVKEKILSSAINADGYKILTKVTK